MCKYYCCFALLLATVACTGQPPARTEEQPSAQPAAQSSTTKETPTTLALAFLATLTADQRAALIEPFAEAGREQWHYVPDTMWPRGGLRLGELNADQKQRLYQLLQAYLSQKGYQKAVDIIELEGVLAQLENNPSYRDRERYHVMFYGDPAVDSLWSWHFEGHHLSLNFTVVEDRIAYSPRFYGANPAIVPSGDRKGFRALGREEELGLELINLLTAEQRTVAILQGRTFGDIVSGHDSQARPLTPKGLAAAAMTTDQQSLLFRLLDEYISAMPAAVAEKRSAQVKKEEMSDIHFAWAGATAVGRPHYYRVQGKSFLLEFDNTQNGGNHIHTVWRDFDGDFGRDLLREHYRRSGHH